MLKRTHTLSPFLAKHLGQAELDLSDPIYNPMPQTTCKDCLKNNTTRCSGCVCRLPPTKK